MPRSRWRDTNLPTLLERHERTAILRYPRVADPVTVIAFVHHPMCTRLVCRPLREPRLNQGGILAGPGCDHDRDPALLIAPPAGKLRGTSAPPAAPSRGFLAPVFLNAPAAGCWACTMGLSIHSGVAGLQRSCGQPAHTFRHTPRFSQRRNR